MPLISPSRPRSRFEAAKARGPKTERRTSTARIELGIIELGPSTRSRLITPMGLSFQRNFSAICKVSFRVLGFNAERPRVNLLTSVWTQNTRPPSTLPPPIRRSLVVTIDATIQYNEAANAAAATAAAVISISTDPGEYDGW